MKSMHSVSIKIFHTISILFSLVWISLLVLPLPTIAQDTQTLLFRDAQKAMQQAKENQAEIYSPTQFSDAMKYYQQAEEAYKKEKSLEEIREKIKLAEVYFAKSSETAKLFKANLQEFISAREDALASEAPQYRKKEWEEAESAFFQTAKTLEEGNLNGAVSKAKKAEALYRQVELESIKANYLDETKALLKGKEKELKNLVPYTLSKAQALVQKAEKLLSENRYDTDEARQLAQEAKYEAQHALFLSQRIEKLKQENQTIEALLLESEKPVQKISNEFDLNARFHQGMDEPTNAVIKEIQKLKKEISSLERDISDKREQITLLSDQLSRMESQLGDLKSKEANLSQIMEQQQLIMEQQRISREKFESVEAAFTPEEAQVVRVEDRVIIRLYGLTFPVGKATIEPKYYGLLTKVLKAVEVYPDYLITIEGHTDSRGSDKANQKLSTDRASAVREYFMATARIDSSRISAVGYGESRPIASNETEEGRRKNRRIETVLYPEKK